MKEIQTRKSVWEDACLGMECARDADDDCARSRDRVPAVRADLAKVVVAPRVPEWSSERPAAAKEVFRATTTAAAAAAGGATAGNSHRFGVVLPRRNS